MSCKHCGWPIFNADEDLLCVECEKEMNDYFEEADKILDDVPSEENK